MKNLFILFSAFFSMNAFSHSTVVCEFKETTGLDFTSTTDFSKIQWDKDGFKTEVVTYYNGYGYTVGIQKDSEDIFIFVSRMNANGSFTRIFSTYGTAPKLLHNESALILGCHQ